MTLGIARRMLDTYVELARGKHSRASPDAMASNNAVQREIGQFEARLSAARAFLHEAAGEVYEAAAAGKLDLDLRIRLRLATTYGMNEATDVSVACYRAAGTTAIMRFGAVRAPLPRRHERQPASAGDDAPFEMVGRHILGTENVVQFV